MADQILIPSGSSLVSPQALDSITVTGKEQQRIRLLDTSGSPIDPIIKNVSTTGTITALNQTVVLTLSSHSSFVVVNTGTWSATINIELSYDGGSTWKTVWANDVTFNSGYAYPYIQQNNFVQEGDCLGATHLRVSCSAYTSGTATITLAASHSSNTVRMVSPLPPGDRTIGSVGISSVATGAAVTGGLTTGTTTIGGATDYSTYTGLHVVIVGTYAAFTVNFEASPDGGTNWVGVGGQREDNAVAEGSSIALPANASRSWAFYMGGFNRFRVRASAAPGTGTATVFMLPTTISPDPVVSAVVSSPSTRVERVLTTANTGTTTYAAQAGVVAEALLNLSSNLGGTASNATTTFSPTAGKAYKITGLTLQVTSGAAAIHFGRVHLRAVSTGTVLATSPILATAVASTQVATSGVVQAAYVPLDVTIPSGWSYGLSHIETATTTTTWATLHGYEI